MNPIHKRDLSTIENNNSREGGPTSLIAAAKLHEAKILSEGHALPIELGIDPLYAPLIEAAEALRQKIQEKNKEKIESVKRETAEQTQNLYYKLSDARNEYDRLEQQYKKKSDEVDRLTLEQEELENHFNAASTNSEKQAQLLKEQENTIENLEKDKLTALKTIEEENAGLAGKLQNKIEQITQDYSQQLQHLQQKLNYEQQRLLNEVSALTDSNSGLLSELHQLREDHQLLQQGSGSFEEKIQQLKTENESLTLHLKNKSENLLRTEHSFKLANEELQRNQTYIKELEDKNNVLQKEVFENWIHKKDEL